MVDRVERNMCTHTFYASGKFISKARTIQLQFAMQREVEIANLQGLYPRWSMARTQCLLPFGCKEAHSTAVLK
jgi:hypothetical protein